MLRYTLSRLVSLILSLAAASVVIFLAIEVLPGDPAANHRELTLQPLDLTPAERADLKALLQAFTGEPLPGALTRAPDPSPGPVEGG